MPKVSVYGYWMGARIITVLAGMFAFTAWLAIFYLLTGERLSTLPMAIMVFIIIFAVLKPSGDE